MTAPSPDPSDPSASVPEHVRGLACNKPDQGGWCWQRPRPSGNLILDYAFVDAQTGWSVGEQGDILKTTDGGASWTRQLAGTAADLIRVEFADASHGWILRTDGKMLRTSNGGATWSSQDLGLASTSSDFSLTVIDARSAVVHSRLGGVRTTADGGATWTARDVVPTAIGADGTLWALDGDTLRKSTDLGQTVSAQSVDRSRYGRLILSGAQVVLAGTTARWDGGLGQTLYQVHLAISTDGGQQWARSTSPELPLQDNSLASLDVGGSGEALVHGPSDLFRTANGGATWTRLALPQGVTQVLDSDLLPGGVPYFRAATSGGTSLTFISDDRGDTWRSVPALGNKDVQNSLRRLGADTWLLKSLAGGGLSTDGMRSWKRLSGSDADWENGALSLWFFDARRGLSINRQGQLLSTTTGGLTWTTSSRNTFPAYVFGPRPRLQFASSSTGWLLSAEAGLHRSTDGGVSWSGRLHADDFSIRAFQFVDEQQGFALAYQQSRRTHVLLASRDGGQGWERRADLPDSVGAFAFGNASQGVIDAGSGRRILTTSDGGRTWADSGTWPSSASTISGIVFSQPDVAWAVGDHGLLLNSRDGGKTWTELVSGTRENLTSVRFLDTQRGWAVGEKGTLLVTTDGGRTWTPQATGTRRHLLDVMFTDSRTGWLTTEDGAVLATGTGGQ